MPLQRPYCACEDSWFGLNCDSQCFNGNTTTGECVCDPCYSGTTCNVMCRGQGTCVDDVCECDPGWYGPDCRVQSKLCKKLPCIYSYSSSKKFDPGSFYQGTYIYTGAFSSVNLFLLNVTVILSPFNVSRLSWWHLRRRHKHCARVQSPWNMRSR